MARLDLHRHPELVRYALEKTYSTPERSKGTSLRQVRRVPRKQGKARKPEIMPPGKLLVS